jgi:hypothetical protein
MLTETISLLTKLFPFHSSRYQRNLLSSSLSSSFFQSKTDIVQQSFYVAIAGSMNLPAAITPAEFYSDTNVIFQSYNTYPNFLTYLVNGNQHCFTPSSVYYTADAISADDNGQTATKEMMSTWTGHFPLATGQSETTICEGTIQYASSANETVTAVDRTTYCSKALYSKVYTQH